jgi:hypothetical protein
MLILRDRRFISAPFDSEREIESAVAANAEFLFGPNSIYLPKALLRSTEGLGAIPDGYVLDLLAQRWFLIDAELTANDVWTTIAPKVAREIITANQQATRRLLIESVIDLYRNNESICARFEESKIVGIDVRRALSDIFQRRPIVGILIDAMNVGLREWAHTLNTDVKLWLIRKFVDFEDPKIIAYEMPDEYSPTFDSAYMQPPMNGTNGSLLSKRTIQDVSMRDLLTANLLKPNEKLTMSFSAGEDDTKIFEASLFPDGSLSIQGRRISSISDAAVFCMKQAGGNQRTANGWAYWKNEEGYSLDDLRRQFLNLSVKALKTK